MRVASGYFKNENGNNVIYEIDECVTDHTYSLYFFEIGEIYHYTRRRDQFNIEVQKKELRVKPKYERTLEEYQKLIREFYKENIDKINSSEFFSCSIQELENSQKNLETSKYDEEKIEEYLETTKMLKSELANYIYTHKKSPYSR